MSLKSDLAIANAATLRPIAEIAAEAGLLEDEIELHGRHVAKVDLSVRERLADRPNGKYVVVTAVTPTPLGEGKTTTSVGLAQGLAHIGSSSMLALRQPSMGPTFGIKGGAAGGGYSQVVPMEKLNLHLTGDFHAITAAHNLLAAMIDNHLHHGNKHGIDIASIDWRRVLDVNDRVLRNVVTGLGVRADGVARQTGFDITAASEVMVTMSLATSLADLRERLGRIVVAYTPNGRAVTAEELKAAGAMTVLLKDALQPNLLQTLEGTPALIHAGPFGNIATGNSSVVACQLGIKMADVLVTEAGFGADMGAERFFNVKCRASGLKPDAAVIVVTVRALKLHSGRFKVVPGKPLPQEMLWEDPDDVMAGASNLRKHIDIIRTFGVTPVVAINAFPTDHPSEHEAIKAVCAETGTRAEIGHYVVKGGEGAADLAHAVLEACEEPSQINYTYETSDPLVVKLQKVAGSVYGADGIELSAVARRDLERYERLGFSHMPVVIAKTHLSISHDPSLRGAPTGWRLPVREVRLAAGAGYVYAICGDMRTMPGLGLTPNAENIDIDEKGNIIGLS